MEKIREEKREEIQMPYITVESGVLSDMQKEKLSKRQILRLFLKPFLVHT